MKKVTEFELNSLISKFKHLCNAGFEASLLVSSKDGQASVSLKVELGHVFHSPNGSTAGENKNSKQRKKRPPAYYRRQKKRRDARKKEMINSTTAAENATATRNLVVNESSSDDSDAAECKLALISSVNEKMVSESSIKNIAAETEDVVFAVERDDDMNKGLKEQLELLIRESQRKRDVWEEMRLDSTTTEENDSFM